MKLKGMRACASLACALALAAPAVGAELVRGQASTAAGSSIASEVRSPLLAIDRNRTSVVERIVSQWGDALAAQGTGISADQLREMLLVMRSDHLLAASLVGSLEGLRNVVASALASDERARPSLLAAKALGDADKDVVYVPVTPCRLVETRGTFPAVYQTGGAFTTGEIRSYTLQGDNGVCLTQLPPGAAPSALQMQVYGIPTTAGSGDIEILPQGGAFGSTATMVYGGSTNGFTSTAATSLVNTGNNQISVQVRGGGAHVVIDVVGYFRPPPGGFVSGITAGAGLTGGGSGGVNLAVDTTVIQSRVTGTCATGSSIRTINADGTVACQADNAGSGTVTSVATGTGLTGGPITTTGTVSIAPLGVATPQLADAAVTKPKMSAAGGTDGQVLTTDGTSLAWAAPISVQRWSGQISNIAGPSGSFVFAGPTMSLTVPAAGRRVNAVVTGAMGTSTGVARVDLNVCYRRTAPTLGPVSEFVAFGYQIVDIGTAVSMYTVTDTAVFSAGTYDVGLCVRNSTAVQVNVNDYTKGVAIVTAP